MSDTHLIGALCPPGRRYDWTPLWVGALAAVASGAACAVVYAIASSLGAIPHDVVLPGLAGDTPLTPGLVITAATVAATGAGLIFGIMRLVSRRPVRVFRLVALAVFLISLATLFAIHGAPGGMTVTLLTMHVLVAVISVGLLTTLIGRRPG